MERELWGWKAVGNSRGENRKAGVFMAGVIFNVMGLKSVKLQNMYDIADLRGLKTIFALKNY